MKTFKLISMQISDDDGLTDIELEDGLIINKEDDESSWLMEAFVEHKYIPYFDDACSSDKEIIAQVVITKRENDPASFATKVCSVKKLKDHASVLLKGKLKKTKNDYPEQLLEHLLEKGLSGTELLTEFKEKIISRPKLVLPKKG
ncbi:YwpF family protein [Bacillus sp. T33-2]|uniref:YwpF family protein n=1 Tax=Bacillus sp. T33-2 TaxID=2054168 RepID=UPI000C78A848|nr:YwpF family protein [Bacillus sp. T33-2]PLR94483.1 hypothetical protein CVD19_17505 [Bacillus sp. T33-2]